MEHICCSLLRRKRGEFKQQVRACMNIYREPTLRIYKYTLYKYMYAYIYIHNGYLVFSEDKAARAYLNIHPPSSAEVEGGVELYPYFCTPFGPSCLVP
jgi:hypothetical protein